MHDVPIVFAFDTTFAIYCAVSLMSIVINSSHRHRIFCFSDALRDEDLRRFEFIRSRFDCEIMFQTVDTSLSENWRKFAHIEKSAYYRISALRDMRGERCVYLDADILMTSDISPLLDVDLQGALLGAVRDPVGVRTSTVPMDDRSEYFNSGVMLVDLPRIQSFGVIDRFQRAYRDHEHLIRYADQCVLNNILQGQHFSLEEMWNKMFTVAQIENKEADFGVNGRPCLLHYCGSVKPWMAWCSDEVTNFWLGYARLLGLQREHVMRNPSTLQDYAAMIRKFERAGDFKASSRIKDMIINHYARKEAQSSRSSVASALSPGRDSPK